VNGTRLVMVLVGLAACAAAPTAVGVGAHEGRVLVRLAFEPPLADPGLLTVDHESGAREQVHTARSGVDLWLPPGPASLRLESGGKVWERPLVVGADREVVWTLPAGPRSP